MPIARRFTLPLLLASLALSCAGQPQSAATAQDPLAGGPQPVVFDTLPAAAAVTPSSPYAPTRTSASPPHYAWQTPTPTQCIGKPQVLHFDGPVGTFPLLSDAEADALASAQAQPPAEHRPTSPDLVVASLRPAFRNCFSRWLDAKSDAEGSVQLALELGCAGEVHAISADAKGVDDQTVGCLFGVVGPAQFEPPAGGHATLKVPVVFKNASR